MRRMRAYAAVFLAALTAVMLTGCFYVNLGGDMVVGNGELETRDIELDSAVTGLTNQTSVDVIIDMDLKGKAVLEAESNLIDLVEVSQSSDGNVTVDMKPHTSFSLRKPMTLRIPAIEGGRIEINGSGDVSQTGRTLTGESFDIHISGSGDIKISMETQRLSLAVDGSGDMDLSVKVDEANVRSNGSGDITISGLVQDLDVSLSGSGSFRGFDFSAQEASVDISGSGDANVFVTGKLTGSINGSGDITYDGDPDSVSISDNGSGEVHQR